MQHYCLVAAIDFPTIIWQKLIYLLAANDVELFPTKQCHQITFYYQTLKLHNYFLPNNVAKLIMQRCLDGSNCATLMFDSSK